MQDKHKSALFGNGAEVPANPFGAVVPADTAMNKLLHDGLSKGKIQSMKNYADELVRKNPKMKPLEVQKQVARKYGVQFK